MELASMLACEPFSDHPRSVCPVIATFLRAYNDGLPDDRRQELYAYASKVVGSASGRRIRRARARRCLTWYASEVQGADAPSRASLILAGWTLGSVGRAAARASRSSMRTHRSVLRLLDELVALGGPAPGVPTLNLERVGSAESLQPQL
ncbi:MAG TPA: hypothetical protein VH817_17775 [Thermoleophilaceae bacterium]|jgi:hypothetical protein